MGNRIKLITETTEFECFSTEIDYLIEFLDNLSGLICQNGNIISLFDKSVQKSYDLGSSLIDSSTQTLRSLRLCCSIGSFSDANTLLRKLRDDLLLYVYIVSVIDSQDPMSNKCTPDEEAVAAWFNNQVKDMHIKKLDYKNYMNVLKQDENIIKAITSYKLDNYWEALRKRLNSYVHNNGINYSYHNQVSAYDKNLKAHLHNIEYISSYIVSFFVVLLFLKSSHIFSSTDYADYLDLNLTPPEHSQSFLAPFVQEIIDKLIIKMHPELKQYLQEFNSHGMIIE